MGEVLAVGTWQGDAEVLGTGWPVEVLASDPLPGEVVKGRQLPRLRGRTACWIRCYGPEGEERRSPMYRSCDLFDLDLSDEDYDRLSALASDHIGNSTTMVPTLGVERVDALAQEIRRVDGSNSLGAGALAEALMPFVTRGATLGVEGDKIARCPIDNRQCGVMCDADDRRDCRETAASPDHIGNSTTMVPTLDVEGVAQIIRQHLNAPVASCALLDIDEAARAIIAAMEKNQG